MQKRYHEQSSRHDPAHPVPGADDDFAVVTFAPSSGHAFTAVGQIPRCDAREVLEITGDWADDPKYGRQFRVDAAVCAVPSTAPAIEQFLIRKVKGCGPKLAERILSATGQQFDEFIRNHKDTLSGIKGMTPALLAEIERAWLQNALDKQVSLFLAEQGVSLSWARKVIARFGVHAVEILRANPYKFIEIEGIGFKKADEIAQRMGWARSSPERAEAVLIYLVNEQLNGGHTFVHLDSLIGKLAAVGVPKAVADGAVAAQTAARRIVIVPARDAGGLHLPLVYLRHTLEFDQKLAEMVDARVSTGALVFDTVLNAIISDAEHDLDVVLTEQQRAGVIQAFQHSVSIVTGGPGTGKSTLVKVLARVARSLSYGIALCAPFGRAGKNLANITGHKASTVHRLLDYKPDQGGWLRNSSNPLQEDIVVADEWSTADLELAFRLFDGCALSTNILLIGDDNQLPSVGAGRVLNDMIQSGRVPVTRLDRVHRQAQQSQIIRNAHRVLAGQTPNFPLLSDSQLISPPAEITEGGARAEWAQKTLVETLCRTLPERHGTDPFTGVQVLSPMRRGSLGINELNGLLQAALNPPSPEKDEIVLANRLFRAGDRVLVTKNSKEEGVYNGDIGILKGIDTDEEKLWLGIDGEDIAYPFEKANHLALAYAITVHKAGE